MSYAIDANLLIYASAPEDPAHAAARAFLESCATGREPLCLSWPTIMAYLRVTTHPGLFRAPLSPAEAMSNVENLLRRPQVQVLTEEEGFFDVYREVAGPAPIRGRLVHDAHLAALLLQHGVKVVYTADIDLVRFGFLDVRNPLRA